MQKGSKIIIGLLLIIIIILITGGVYLFVIKKGKEDDTKTVQYQQMLIDTRQTDEVSGENPLKNRTVSFVGLNDAILENGGKIVLENLPENGDFFMKFEVTDIDKNETVLETDLIEAGKHIDWVPSETLNAGTYHLAFLQVPFWRSADGQYIPLTAGNNEVTIILQ